LLDSIAISPRSVSWLSERTVTYVSGPDKWNDGEPGGTRTRDHRIKSAMLYQLSYRPFENLQV
jgi:hypothetical protein